MSQITDRSNPPIHAFKALQSEPAEGNSESSRIRSVEARLEVLETAILEHATILRDRIGKRLDRLEDKLRYEASGLRRAMAEENGTRDQKIVQLTECLTAAVDRVELKQESGAVNATMEDLIAALAATRTHLDTLASTVSKARTDLSA